jgi:hypothetical protein
LILQATSGTVSPKKLTVCAASIANQVCICSVDNKD